MEQTVRRVLLAGTSSGCGKTTVVCALLQALVDRGLRVGAFKCGPDYIDPMFHSRIIGARSGNLDGFFFSENTMRLLLAKNSADRDISVIEGVMGYYDGAGLTSTAAAGGGRQGGGPLRAGGGPGLSGLSGGQPHPGGPLQPLLRRDLPGPGGGSGDTVRRQGAGAGVSAGAAGVPPGEPAPGPCHRRDRAFCFYYEDSLGALEEMGAELVRFSPLEDEALPEGIDGLCLGGGYPELCARQLAENKPMRRAVRQALEEGTPCVAECGGFMYLTEAIGGEPMVGALPGDCFDRGRLTRFGYVTLRSKADNLLCRAGEEIRGHEFHHWDARQPGDGFTAVKPSGRSWDCAVATDRLYAGFPHLHFYANLNCARRFYEACLARRRERRG